MKRIYGKNMVSIILITAIVVIPVVFFYTEENWRAARDWVACQRNLAAKGETLDLHQLVPPGNPKDDLSKVPIFAPLYQKKQDTNAPILQLDINLKTKSKKSQPDLSFYLAGSKINLEDWRKFYLSVPESNLGKSSATPAQDVLKVFSRFDSQLKEIDHSMDNPNAFFPLNYDNPSAVLVFITPILNASSLFDLRGLAYLENGEVNLAQKDYLSTFKLLALFGKVGGSMNYVILVLDRHLDNCVLWEGLHRHLWNQEQLQEMETALAQEDMLNLPEGPWASHE